VTRSVNVETPIGATMLQTVTGRPKVKQVRTGGSEVRTQRRLLGDVGPGLVLADRVLA
jgi:hypothetical protein